MGRPSALNKKTFNMILGLALKRRLARIAEQENRDLAAQIRDVLEDFAEAYEKKEKTRSAS